LHRKCGACEEENNQVTQAPEKKEEEEKKVQRLEEKKEEEKKVQRMGDKKEEEDKKVQRKDGNEEKAAPDPESYTAAYLNNLQGRGHALPPYAQQYFGERMGYDFSGVKIHTGTEATQSARAINAQAYTWQNNIVFNEGKYDTGTSQGKKLLAHELTHVAQQQGATAPKNDVSRRVNITAPYPVVEDFDPVSQFQKQSPALGRCDSLLNGVTQLPSLGAGNFEKALVKPDLDEKDLGAIPRPNLSDASLDGVRANKVELSYRAYGKNVQLIQEALIAWGKGLDEPVVLLPKFGPDKDYRGETKGAVIFFQERHPSLAVDGIVGDETLAALQHEMGQLTGSVFSIKDVGVNDFTGLIHKPPPSAKWNAIVTSTNSFFNKSIDPFDQATLATQFSKCNVRSVVLSYKDAGGVVPSILTHEQVHEKDQLKTINDHLLKWDVDLSIAQILNFKFKAANRAEADKKLYTELGIPDPDTLSKTIIKEFSQGNKAFHQSAAGAAISTSLSLPSCIQVVFTLSK
jgi:peptidoglycan hydrolase-like protein with peptidoglycan-binding domain